MRNYFSKLSDVRNSRTDGWHQILNRIGSLTWRERIQWSSWCGMFRPNGWCMQLYWRRRRHCCELLYSMIWILLVGVKCLRFWCKGMCLNFEQISSKEFRLKICSLRSKHTYHKNIYVDILNLLGEFEIVVLVVV